MVNFSKALAAVVAAVVVAQVAAHPGHDISQEIAERNAFFKNSAKRGLSHCSSSLRKRGVEEASIKRRHLGLQKARAERGLPLREYILNPAFSGTLVVDSGGCLERRGIVERSVTDESHLSSLDVTPTTPGVEEIIFANSTCLLSPEGEEGPYCKKLPPITTTATSGL
jgi:hypothetical protein